MSGRLLGTVLLLLLPVAASAHGEHGSARPLGSGELDVAVRSGGAKCRALGSRF